MAAPAKKLARDWILPTLAGVASGVLFLTLLGGGAMMPLVAYFVQLPLFFVGFSLGATSATVGALIALALVLLASGGIAGLIFAVVEAVPLLVLTRSALLSRQDETGGVEWYPVGMALVSVVVYTLGATLFVLVLLSVNYGDLAALLSRGVTDIETQLAAKGVTAPVGEQLGGLTAYLPGIVAASWLMMVLLNGMLGQWLAGQQGKARRPTPRLRDLQLPSWIIPAMALAVVGTVMTGDNVAIMSGAAAVILAVPLLFQGLAVVHTLVKRLPAPRAALFGFYLVLVLFSWPLVLIVVMVGVLEEWAQFRQRSASQ